MYSIGHGLWGEALERGARPAGHAQKARRWSAAIEEAATCDVGGREMVGMESSELGHDLRMKGRSLAEPDSSVATLHFHSLTRCRPQPCRAVNVIEFSWTAADTHQWATDAFLAS
jgi:hypothetical protein